MSRPPNAGLQSSQDEADGVMDETDGSNLTLMV